MRRDMDFCIDLLEGFSKGYFKSSFQLRDMDDKFYLYQLELLRDANLVDYDLLDISGGYGLKYCPKLTWEGNDFLELVENDTILNKTKEVAKAKGIELFSLPIDVMKAYLKMQTNNILGIDL
ncbi:DUF2513 domain-containing protein [Sporosarcina sp. P16b]|uniref:DUF2513 domain-containing protein n=1 Tax=Sporosarcina sp. P16b TaxID=2048261 RepID=UPI0013045220|nr:DUF2513 domain-containing protein [Sporosarcina sp. P16b]